MKQSSFILFLLVLLAVPVSAQQDFVPNKGQVRDAQGHARADVLYTAATGDAILYFFNDRIVFVIKESLPVAPGNAQELKAFRFDLVFPGAASKVEAMSEKASYTNYYLPHCPTGITAPSYSTLVYRDLFEGVDLFVTDKGRGIELIYSFKELKHSVLDKMKETKYEGISGRYFGRQGIPLITPFGNYEQLSYKVSAPDKELVKDLSEGSERIASSATWCTYIGGSDADEGSGIAIDNTSNSFVTGYTQSLDLPVGTGTIQSSAQGSYDAFVYKLDNNGNRVWATYYGGTGNDFGYRIKTWNNNIIFCGYGSSTDIPITTGAWQDTSAGSYDAFIVKLDQNGTLYRSTYFGGAGGEFALGLAIDNAGNVIMGGSTSSSTLPLSSSGYQPANAGPLDAYCVKFDSTLTCQWSTFYGGSASEDIHGLTTDSNGNIILAGGTYSNDFPVSSNAYQPMNMGAPDGYVVKLSASGSRQWSTMIGGSNMEDANAVVCDKWNNIYISGYTYSNDFPVTPNAYQQASAGGSDVFVSKLATSGTLQWSTYYGGTMEDNALGIAVDTSIHVFISGYTRSSDLPVSSAAFQINNAGNSDAYFLRLDSAGAFGWASYFGGAQDDRANDLAVDAGRNVFIAGTTYSNDLPDTNGVFQPVYAGSGDAFAVVMDGSYGITVNMQEHDKQARSVFPNPTTGKIFITGAEEIEMIRITDVAGRLVKEISANGNTVLEADISELPAGAYYLVSQGRSINVTMIIKM
jgi:hypothetical protein